MVPIQDSAATLDAVAVPAGLAMLWFPRLAIPALFISGGAHKEDLSLLKGEVVAIDAGAREKPCPQIVQYIEVNRLAGEAAATNVSR